MKHIQSVLSTAVLTLPSSVNMVAMSGRLSLASATIDTAQTESAEANVGAATKDKVLNDLTNEASSIRREVATLNEELLSVGGDTQGLLPPATNDHSISNEGALKDLMAAAAADYSQLIAGHSRLKGDLSQADARLAELTQQSRASVKGALEIETLMRKLSDLQGQITSLEASAAALKSEIDGQELGSTSDAASMKSLAERLKTLQADLLNVKGSYSSDITATSTAEQHLDGPSPHQSLRTKCARSSIALLKKEIDELNVSSAQKQATITATETFIVKSAAAQGANGMKEQDREAELAKECHQLEDDLSALHRSVEGANTRMRSVLDRHAKSLQTFENRVAEVNKQFTTLPAQVPTMADPAKSEVSASITTLRGTVKELTEENAQVEARQRKGEKRLKELEHLLSSQLALSGPNSGPVAHSGDVDYKAQIDIAKEAKAALEAEIEALKVAVHDLSAKRNALESSVGPSSSKVSGADDRTQKLQQEIDRRDACIARLRQEAGRIKSLEAKLLSTKVSVSVQKQNIIQDAQHAASRSLALERTEDALLYARRATRDSTKGL
eukprot:GILJ01017501.1.p1 GENE.GILJ01017501.1~~GILJ01017501.1.p1  ORF type:complete len:628 (-),score=117.28 GILJ01017501.1:1370-3046(-)